MEIWKDITNFKGTYQVSNLGRIRRLRKWCGNKYISNYVNELKIVNGYKDSVGYKVVTLSLKEKNRQRVRIHRIVAQEFLLNPLNKETVNHINGNKIDNRVENLEWATYQENNQHAHNTGLKHALKSKDNKLSKEVDQYDKYGNFIKRWDCMQDVERNLKISNSSVCQCCLKRLKTAGGFVWKYAK